MVMSDLSSFTQRRCRASRRGPLLIMFGAVVSLALAGCAGGTHPVSDAEHATPTAGNSPTSTPSSSLPIPSIAPSGVGGGLPARGWAAQVVGAGSSAYIVGWTPTGAGALWHIDPAGRLARRAAPPGMPGSPALSAPESRLLLAFAGPRTGLAITNSGATDASGAERANLYSTDDGARSWTKVHLATREQPTLLAIGGGSAYVLTIHCVALNTRCDHATLWSIDPTGVSAPGTFASLPGHADASGATLAAYGKQVWLLLNLGEEPGTSLVSRDSGRTWQPFGVAPCQTEDLKPTSAEVLWETCGTGMLQHFARQEGSATPLGVFQRETSGTSNSALLPISDTTAFAVIDGPGRTRIDITRDGGHTTATIASVRRPIARSDFRTAFVSDRVGYIVTANGGELYRTEDGARSWHLVAAPSAT